MIDQNDRIAFSLAIVSAEATIKGISAAQASLADPLLKAQNLDTANKNLFDPINTLITQYQQEFNQIDGNLRSTIVEQNMLDAGNRILQNYFYPNDTTVSVPSLSPSNIWTKTVPFALNYAIGKNYTQTYDINTSNENANITAIQGFFTTLSGNTDIQNTTGQIATSPLSAPIITFTALQTLSINLNSTVNAWKTALQAEATALAAIVDPNPTNTANNAAALANINSVIIPAVNTWLALPTFTPMPGTTTGTVFNATNPATLLPHPQLYSVNLATLTAAVSARKTFVTTRTSQLNSVLGTITQDITTGAITSSSGFYGQRYPYIDLRLDLFNGSLIKVLNLENTINAQNSVKSSLTTQEAIYMSILPTSPFKAAGNNTPVISIIDPTLFSQGDQVYIYSEGQTELVRAIKSISGDSITLNDIVPAKYRVSDKARIYKDIS